MGWDIIVGESGDMYVLTPVDDIYMGDADTMTEEETRVMNLIAAAPDLLEACKMHKAVGDHVAICPKCGDSRPCHEYDQLWNKADRLSRAAITKAEPNPTLPNED